MKQEGQKAIKFGNTRTIEYIYGADGNVQKEYNKGHQGSKTPKVEKSDHVHDYKPNPHHPEGKPTRMPGRPLKPNEISKDRFKTKK